MPTAHQISGTWLMAFQLARNVSGASKVITIVFAGKALKVPELLGEGVVDEGLSVAIVRALRPS